MVGEIAKSEDQLVGFGFAGLPGDHFRCRPTDFIPYLARLGTFRLAATVTREPLAHSPGPYALG